MNKQFITTLQNDITHYDTIILHRHVRPDPDAIGSQLGLKAGLLAMHPNKKVYAVGEMTESLSFMGEMDDIDDQAYDGALVIVLDTANAARISDDRYKLGARLIKIDHHPPEDQYADLNIVDVTASSTSELVFELLEVFGYGYDYITDEAAKQLYLGIVGDTGRFLFNNTTPRTMEIASICLTRDFSHTDLLNKMSERSAASIHFQGYVLQHFHYEDHVAWIFITPEILSEFNISAQEASLFVNSLSDIFGIKAWVFAVDEGPSIRARIRSKYLPINQVASRYNGGGHPHASGATVYSEEELMALLSEVKQAVN